MASDEGKEQSTAAQFQELRKRVIRADNALRCCSRAGAAVAMDAIRIANEFLARVVEAPDHKDESLVMAPIAAVGGIASEVETTFTIQWLKPVGGAGMLGTILLFAGAELAAVIAQTQALSIAEGMANAIGTLSSRRRTGCYECIKRSVLTQSHERLNVTTKIRRRL